MGSRRSAFVTSGIILTIVVAIIVTCWLRYRRPAPIVAIIPETTAQELWESEHAGVAATIAGTPWGTYWNGPSSEDQVAQQIALVQQTESIHAAGLILAPDDCLALTTPVRHVLDKGIPTVIVSTGLPIDPRRNLGFVLNDDKAAGELAATYVARILKGHGTVALLGDNSNVLSSTARADAFAQTLKSRFPGVQLVAQPQGSFRLGETEQQTETVLRANPKLSAIVSIGITQTRGTMFALRSFGRQKNVALIAFDQDLDLMYSLRHGDIDAVVAQDTFSMGKQAMQMVERFQRNSAAPSLIRVAPVLVTRDNIDNPGIQQVLSMDWRPRQP
jgi:ribose transport system substrate-binding protein